MFFLKNNNYHILYLLVFLLLWLPSGLQAQQTQSVTTIGGPIFDKVNGLSPSPTGGFYIAGEFENTVNFGTGEILTSLGSKDGYLLKTNAFGSTQWALRLGGSGYQRCNKVATLPNGGAVVAGHYYNMLNYGAADTLPNQGENDAYVVVVDAMGAPQWAASIGGAGRDAALDVAVCDSGFIYLTGFFTDSITTSLGTHGVAGNNFFLARYSPTGTLQWLQTGSFGPGSEPMAVTALPTGGAAIAGFFSGSLTANGATLLSQGYTDAFVVGYHPNGTLRYQHSFGSYAYEFIMAMQADTNGNLIIGGSFNGILNLYGTTKSTSGYLDAFMASINPQSLQTNWLQASTLSTNHTQTNALHIYNNQVLSTGQYEGNTNFANQLVSGQGGTDIFVVSYHLSTGAQHWAIGGGGSNGQATTAACYQPMNQTLAIGGEQNGTIGFGGMSAAGKGSSDGFLITLTDTTPVLGTQHPHLQQDKASLLRVFPNPASGLINIQTHSQQPTQVELLGLQGNILRSQVITGQGRLQLQGLPAGMYLLRWHQGTHTGVHKIMVQ